MEISSQRFERKGERRNEGKRKVETDYASGYVRAAVIVAVSENLVV